MLEQRGATYVDYTIQAPGRVAVAILRFQLDSCEKKTAKERLNRGWTRRKHLNRRWTQIYAEEARPRISENLVAAVERCLACEADGRSYWCVACLLNDSKQKKTLND